MEDKIIDSNSIITAWLLYDKLKKAIKFSQLEDKQSLLTEYNEARTTLAHLIIKLDAQWPMETKSVEKHFEEISQRQIEKDIIREVIVLKRGESQRPEETIIKYGGEGGDEYIHTIKQKILQYILKDDSKGKFSKAKFKETFKLLECYLSRTNIGIISFENANVVHEMEVLGPLRKKLSLEKDMAKLRVTLNPPSSLDFEEDLNNLPILKHINQPNNPIYLVFSPGMIRVQTTCYFKSEKMKSLYTVKSETPNYTYFASFLDTKIELDGDSTLKDVSSRLLTFSQQSELF